MRVFSDFYFYIMWGRSRNKCHFVNACMIIIRLGPLTFLGACFQHKMTCRDSYDLNMAWGGCSLVFTPFIRSVSAFRQSSHSKPYSVCFPPRAFWQDICQLCSQWKQTGSGCSQTWSRQVHQVADDSSLSTTTLPGWKWEPVPVIPQMRTWLTVGVGCCSAISLCYCACLKQKTCWLMRML